MVTPLHTQIFRDCNVVVAIWLLSMPALAIDRESVLLEMTVTPSAVGRQMVRASLPFRAGELQQGETLVVDYESQQISAAVRPLGWQESDSTERSVRTALVTFPYEFDDLKSVRLQLRPSNTELVEAHAPEVQIQREDGDWLIEYAAGDKFRVRPIWPDSETSTNWQLETVEDNAYFHWHR